MPIRQKLKLKEIRSTAKVKPWVKPVFLSPTPYSPSFQIYLRIIFALSEVTTISNFRTFNLLPSFTAIHQHKKQQ